MNDTKASDDLHTQCPYCNTLFQITKDQLTAQEGKVRCGYCYRTFNAKETLINELTENQITSPPPASPIQINLSKPDDNALATISLAKQELQAETRQQLDATKHKSASGFSFRNSAWGLGVTIMALTFIAQYTYFYRNDLAQQHAQVRPWLANLCGLFDCQMPLIKAPQQLKLISHDMRLHPKHKNVLRVRGTFVNQADFSQPYPIIKLSLTDLNGKIIAQRTFAADAYLPPQPSYVTGIPPLGQLDAELNIVDRNPNIVGFSLEIR